MMTTTTLIIVALTIALAIAAKVCITLKKNLEETTEQLTNARIENGIMEANINSLQEQKENNEQQQQATANQFKVLAAEIIKEQTAQMNKQSQESLDQMLKPFHENIKSFRERVEKIYAEDNTQRGELKNELKNLMALNQKITTETSNLTSALRGNSKVQGDWGEMILERILESSNLIKGTHYTTQENMKDEEGNNIRPDVILKLPDNKSIVIDSKASITAFVNYASAETEEQRKNHIAAHIQSIKTHIKSLSSKEYQKSLNSPDFVIMFIPSEPAFLAAMQTDNTLWAEAYDNKVVVSSPTNLFSMLKMVNDLWRRDAQDKNTEKIVEQGSKLFDQLTLFVESLDDVGTQLNKAQTAYTKAYDRLATGRGNALKIGAEMKALGIKNKRELSPKATTALELEIE